MENLNLKLTDGKHKNGADSCSGQYTEIPDIFPDVTGPQREQADGDCRYHCWLNNNSLQWLNV